MDYSGTVRAGKTRTSAVDSGKPKERLAEFVTVCVRSPVPRPRGPAPEFNGEVK